MHVDVNRRRGLARIEIEGAGSDLGEEVSQRFRELCLRRLDVIHIDLPPGDSTAMAAVDDLRGLGFFFGAVIPELRNGDILRLQYLNNVALVAALARYEVNAAREEVHVRRRGRHAGVLLPGVVAAAACFARWSRRIASPCRVLTVGA
jgi:hypothetical protein